jgi:RHS repeat-associated protein
MRLQHWLEQACDQLKITSSFSAALRGVVFEVRQGYKSKDSKRQNADIANAATAYSQGYLPVVVVLSSQIDSDVSARYTYDAFGGTSVSGAASENTNQYTSRENDGTGLYFYRARYYSARFGRFVSEDPIRQKGSGANWFAYARNNPISFADPTGLKPRPSAPPPDCYGFWGGPLNVVRVRVSSKSPLK